MFNGCESPEELGKMRPQTKTHTQQFLLPGLI